MKLGEKIKELRIKKNLNQSKLGDIVGVHYTHIGKYENGHQIPSIDTIKKIAKALEVSIDYLVTDENKNSEIKISFEDEELLSQFKRAQILKENDKNLVKEFLDAFLTKKEIAKMVN